VSSALEGTVLSRVCVVILGEMREGRRIRLWNAKPHGLLRVECMATAGTAICTAWITSLLAEYK